MMGTPANDRPDCFWRADLGEAVHALVAVLREGGEAFGMGERPDLAKVLAHPRPDQLMGRLVEEVEVRTRAELQEQAQQRAAQEEARRQEPANRPRPSQRQGPSIGM